MGKRVHEVLEWVYNHAHSFITFDKLQDKFDEIWVDAWHDNIYIARVGETTDQYYNIGLRCLGSYCSRYGPRFDAQVIGTEVKLKFKINDYEFIGVIDRLDNPEPGKWIVHDYKSGKFSKTERQAINDLQLSMYHLAVEQNYEPVSHITLVWHFLRQDITVQISQTREQLEKLQSKVTRQINKISNLIDEKLIFLPKESKLCHWCYYWNECPAKVGDNPAIQAK